MLDIICLVYVEFIFIPPDLALLLVVFDLTLLPTRNLSSAWNESERNSPGQG